MKKATMKNREGKEIDRLELLRFGDQISVREIELDGSIGYESKLESDEYEEALIEFSIRSGYMLTKDQIPST